MKKKIILLALFVLMAFYVAWPMWSAYKIHAALEANDAATLETKVDFPSVRTSLRPAITAEVERAFDRAAGGAAGQILGGALKQQLAPQLVDTVINGVITPQRIGEFYQRRGDIKEILAERIARREAREAGGGIQIPGLGRIGSARAEGQKGGEEPKGAEKPVEASAAGKLPREKPGLANVKYFAVKGPLAFEVGVARNKADAAPDVIAQIAFKDFDWKLVGIVPRAR